MIGMPDFILIFTAGMLGTFAVSMALGYYLGKGDGRREQVDKSTIVVLYRCAAQAALRALARQRDGLPMMAAMEEDTARRCMSAARKAKHAQRH